MWFNIPGFSDYRINKLGGVLSLRSQGRMKGYVTKLGYLQVCLSTGDKQKTMYVHRLMSETFLGGVPPGLCTNHIDGVKLNNRLENLEVVTIAHNNLHAIRTGLRKSKLGAKNHLSKFSDQQVLRIRELIAEGKSQYKIAGIFGCNQSTISDIKRKVTGY